MRAQLVVFYMNASHTFHHEAPDQVAPGDSLNVEQDAYAWTTHAHHLDVSAAPT
jgi:hypothetical protein